ncbi:MAG: ribonuclease P protein component [Parcubacteria group bacterium]
MLKKNHSIRKQTEIQEIFKLGKTYKNNSLLAKVKDNNLNKYRMTVIVSSKVCSKAVDRNKIKRQIKYFFLKEIKNKEQNKDFIFVALPGIKSLSTQDLKLSVKKIISLV